MKVPLEPLAGYLRCEMAVPQSVPAFDTARFIPMLPGIVVSAVGSVRLLDWRRTHGRDSLHSDRALGAQDDLESARRLRRARGRAQIETDPPESP